MNGFPPKCGSCIHCDQEGNAFVRWCDKHRRYVNIVRDEPCEHHIGLFEKDLFGETYWDKMYKDNYAVYYSVIL